MKLSQFDKADFISKGFALIPSIVPKDLVNKLKEGVQESVFGPQHKNYGTLRRDKRFEVIQELSGALDTFYKEYVRQIGDSILEDGNEFNDAQYSVMESGRPVSKGWHIDGTWIATDKNSLEGIPFFKLLVGVYLTDLSEPERGNLMVSPGGHHLVADFFRKGGPILCEEPKRAFTELYSTPLPSFHPIIARPGDMIIAHALLPHTISVNNGLDRPVIYFRLGKYEQSGYPALSDVWHEWPDWTRRHTL